MVNRPTDIIIYETDEYDRFNYYTANRHVSENRELENDILACNKLKYHPIEVTPSFHIIDGQHRLEIAKKHKLPIYYIIDRDSKDDDIMLVQNSKKWTQEDYIHFYKQKGIVSYCNLYHIMKNYKVSTTAVLNAFSKKGRNNCRDLRQGKTQLLYTMDFIETVLGKLEILKKCIQRIVKDTIHREFEITLIQMLKNPRCDLDYFVEKLEQNPDELILAKNSRRREMIRERLVYIYNKGLRDKKRKLHEELVK